MKNQNKKYKQVLDNYDIESVEIHNYDLFAKLKDKIKKEKSNDIAKAKESKMARKSKTDTILEVVLSLKNEFNGFKIEVRDEFSKVNSRLDKLENDVNILKDDVSNLKQDVNVLKSDVHILKQDMNSLKSEAIKHGWNV